MQPMQPMSVCGRRSPATLSAVESAGGDSEVSGLVLSAMVAVLAVTTHVVVTDSLPRLVRAVGHAPAYAHDSLFGLAIAMTPSVAFALILLVWGRSPRRRIGGAVLALGAGFAKWGLLDAVWLRVPAGLHLAGVAGYLSLMVPLTLATLAWGVARRSGRRWLWAVPIAPLLAGCEGWLSLHGTWWVDLGGGHGLWLAYTLYLGPVVLACLAGWALDADPSNPSRVRSHPAVGAVPE